jgi:hypothetical protein
MKVKVQGSLITGEYESYGTSPQLYARDRSGVVYYEVDLELDFVPRVEDVIELPNGAELKVSKVILTAGGGARVIVWQSTPMMILDTRRKATIEAALEAIGATKIEG